MSCRMRRKSMERLELYDLDQLTAERQSIPPPLPPPRQRRCRLPPDVAFQRYSFLCDMTRHRIDPIYAATPMFSVIPQQNQVKYHRQLLGIRFPANIVKPLESTSSKDDDENEEDDDKEKTVNHLEDEEEESSEEEEEEQEDESEEDDDDDDNDDDDESSSSESPDDAGGIDDDDDNKGIVEQIFNRDRR